MIILNQGLSKREKILLIILVIVLLFAGYIWHTTRSFSSKYKYNESYCEADYDCTVVYDFVNTKCLSVNNLHKNLYEYDVTCRKYKTICQNNKCILK